MPDQATLSTPAKVAIVLAAELPAGAAANIAACLAAGLSASHPYWAGHTLTDATGLVSVASSHLPIAILRAELGAMQTLARRLTQEKREPDAVVSLFPSYAQAMHDASEYWRRHTQESHVDANLFGIGLYGPKRWVSRLSGSLPLWR